MADPESTLFARQSGRGSDTVVLLHGFGTTHRAWDSVAGLLARGHGVIAYDLPAHGRSPDLAEARSARGMAGRLLADLATRELDRVHLVGHSMGGAVATLMAMAEPLRVASLSLLAPGGFGPQINVQLIRRLAGAQSAAEIADCLAAMSAPGTDRPLAVARALGRAWRSPGRARSLAAVVEVILRGDGQGVIPRPALDALTMPVALAWGRADPVLPVAQALHLPDRFAVLFLEHAGHMLPEEAPAAVAALVEANIRAADRRS